MKYQCYITGLKKHFRTIGLSQKQISVLDRLLEQSTIKRSEVRKIHVNFSKD